MSYSSDNTVEFSCGCSACQSAMQSSRSSSDNSSTTLASSSYDNALLLSSGYTWRNDQDGLELSYKFFDSLPDYYSAGDVEANRTEEFNAQMKSAAERILEQVETFTNISFVETSSDRDAELGFGAARLSDNVGGHAYYPFSSPKGGDIWTNNLYGSTENPSEGNYGFFLLLHEIGHALGLQHSFEVLSGNEANSQYSVMAYDWSPYLPASYMVYDIAALQNQYGANMNYNTGDDTYMLDATIAYSIWDAGGNDTFDTTNTRSNVEINLNDGEYSSVGLTNNIGIAFNAVIENAITGRGNDTVIGNEADNNIQTGGGNDTIYASAGTDKIDGGDGSDTIIYDVDISQIFISIIDSVTVTFQNLISSAIDTLISIENFLFNDSSYSFQDITQMAGATDSAGDAPDIVASPNGGELSGDASQNYILGLSGDDKIYGGAGDDTLDGGEGKNKLYGEEGDDVLTVRSPGRNKLYGGTGDDTLTSAGKKNLLIGGADNDTVNSDGKKNILYGEDGDDAINSEGDSNLLYGDSGDDILSILAGFKNKVFGGGGNDNLSSVGGKNKLKGGDGDDTLLGGAFDALTGGDGADIFDFDGSSDQSTVIRDFDIAEDLLDLSNLLTQYNALDDEISDFLSFTKEGGRTVISVDLDGAGDVSTFEAIATSKAIIDISVNDAEASGILII